MAGEGIFDDYRAKMQDRVRSIEVYLGEGKCSDWDEYKKLTGQIKGMRFAQDDLNDTIRLYRSDEGEIIDESN